MVRTRPFGSGDPLAPMIKADQLKNRQRAKRDLFSKDFDTRVHRAISWLKRSEQEGGDPDVNRPGFSGAVFL